jgi:hypothetical protein
MSEETKKILTPDQAATNECRIAELRADIERLRIADPSVLASFDTTYLRRDLFEFLKPAVGNSCCNYWSDNTYG